MKKPLHDLFVDIEKRRSPLYKALREHNQNVFIKLAADIARTMTATQRQYLDNRVNNYSRHFTQLSKEARLAMQEH